MAASLNFSTAAEERSSEQAAFEYLTNVVSANWHGPLEIEVLPKALQEDELVIRILDQCIGIPHTLLTLAFRHARMLFFDVGRAAPVEADVYAVMRLIMQATQAMLIFDPEHLTAANTRKRYLSALLGARLDTIDVLDDAIRNEMWLLDSLLTSPLHRHTKSPTLWNHRRWLVEEFLEWVMELQRHDTLGSKRMSLLLPQMTIDSTEILWQSFVQPELQLIYRAAEQHPLNYHAWAYARAFLDIISDWAELKDYDVDRIISYAVELQQAWCLSHLADTSAWAFMLWLLSHTDEATVARSFVEVGNIAFTYRYPQDPVWIFIRTLLASSNFLATPFRANFLTELRGWLDGEHETEGPGNGRSTSSFLAVVLKHLVWIKLHWEGEPRPAILDQVQSISNDMGIDVGLAAAFEESLDFDVDKTPRAFDFAFEQIGGNAVRGAS